MDTGIPLGVMTMVFIMINTVVNEGNEGNVLFNDTLNTFYLRLYGVRCCVGLY